MDGYLDLYPMYTTRTDNELLFKFYCTYFATVLMFIFSFHTHSVDSTIGTLLDSQAKFATSDPDWALPHIDGVLPCIISYGYR